MPDQEPIFRPPSHQLVGGLARAAAKWSILLTLLRQVVSIGTTMIVSRYVSPEEFGIAGMVLSFVAFLVLFDTGLTWATVQSPSLDRDKVDSLFAIGGGVGALLWCTTALLAPHLASFYAQPALETITIIMGATVFLNSLTTQPAAVLKRQLRQKETNYIDTAALLLSSFVAIYIALIGGGYWAVVFQAVMLQAARSVLLFIYSGYLPAWPRSFKVAFPELRNGAWLALSNYICYFQLYLGGIIVGKIFGGTTLGNYQKAYGVKSMPTAYATMVITDVMVSSLAALSSDPSRMGLAYIRALRLIAFVGCPAGAMLFAVAPEVIRFLYGEQWGEAIPLLRWFSLAAAALPISTTTIWLFLATGQAKLQLKMNLFLSVVAIASLGLATSFNATVEGIVAVESILFAGPYLIVNLLISHRAVGLNVAVTLRAIAPILIGSALCAYLTHCFGRVVNFQNWWVILIVKLAFGGGVYAIFCFVFVRPLFLGFLKQFR